MPRLVIDALPLLGEGGITNYIRPFCAELIRRTSPEWSAELLFRLAWDAARKNRLAQLLSAGLPPHTHRHVTSVPDSLMELLWSRGLCVSSRPLNPGDLVIATTEMVPRCNRAIVGHFVYDIVPLMVRDTFDLDLERYAMGLFNRLNKADFVITISETTKRDLVERFKYPASNIVVVYPGCDARHIAPKGGSPYGRPYVLYMGSLALNKNVDGLIRIFSRCVRDYRCDVDLVLIGKNFCNETFWRDMVSHLGIADRVHLAGWVNDEKRRDFLAGATMLWLFSWYEGFGLPVLEAAAAGIPVLYSNRGSLPEILANPEQEIDPGDEAAAASKAAHALVSPGLLERWKAHGLARAKEFSWDLSIERFLLWYRGFDPGNKRRTY